MIRIAVYIIFFIGLVSSVLSAHSGEIDINGINSPKFVAAQNAWLEGKDEVALKELARLSRKGNTAAQILLALIESKVNTHVHITSGLSRKQRIDLLRLPQGLSGKSWLTEAEKIAPLAAAFRDAKNSDSQASTGAALVELGEPLTALIVIRKRLNQGQVSEVVPTLLTFGANFPVEAISLFSDAASFGSRGENVSSLVDSILAPYDKRKRWIGHLEWFGPSPADVVKNDKFQALVEVATEVRHWTPMRNFCEKYCAEDSKACTVRGVSSLVGAGLFPMRSPFESLIPNEVYWSSSRVEGDLARLIPDIRQMMLTYLKHDGSHSCFFDKMKYLQSLHGFRNRVQ